MRLDAVTGHAGPVAPGDLWGAWAPDPGLAALLAAAGALYVLALRRLGRGGAGSRGLRGRHAACFAGGLAALAAALLSPLEPLAETLLSAHMAQHLLLTSVAAPLLALGLPLALMPGALPADARRRLHAARRRVRLGGGAACGLALAAHGGSVWLWHHPALYERALAGEAAHALEHATFVAGGLAFWWCVVGLGPRTRPSATALLALFALALQGAALGALLAFSPAPWYGPHAAGAELWGLGALADQQAAGMLMWGAGALAPAAAAAVLLAAWLDRAAAAPLRPGQARGGP